MTAKGNMTDLEHFIKQKMRMSHIYQPLMLKVLLESEGTATLEEIAKALTNTGKKMLFKCLKQVSSSVLAP